MPTYEYICENCGYEFEAFQRITDPPLQCCYSCQQATLKRKVGSGIGVKFTGTGFYETDYKGK